MTDEYRDKLRSIGFPRRGGETKTTTVLREDGTVAGQTIEHGDGRQDAVVTPPPIVARSAAPTPGEAS